MDKIAKVYSNIRYKNLKWAGIGCVRKIFMLQKNFKSILNKPKKKYIYQELIPCNFSPPHKINICNRSINLWIFQK